MSSPERGSPSSSNQERPSLHCDTISLPGAIESPRRAQPVNPADIDAEEVSVTSRKRSSSLNSSRGSQVWEPSMADDGRCVNLNAVAGPNDENFISNYVKTARYEWWNIICVVSLNHPNPFFQCEIFTTLPAISTVSTSQGCHLHTNSGPDSGLFLLFSFFS